MLRQFIRGHRDAVTRSIYSYLYRLRTAFRRLRFIGNKTVIVLAWCVSNTHYIANRTLKEHVYIIYFTYKYKLYNCINWFMLFYNSTIYNCINWFILFYNSTIFVRVHAPPEIIPRVQLHPLHPLFLRL